MSKIAYIKDVLTDDVFAFIVESSRGVEAFGTGPHSSSWAKQISSQKTVDEIKESLDPLLYVTSLITLNESEVEKAKLLVDKTSLEKINLLVFDNGKRKSAVIKKKSLEPEDSVNHVQKNEEENESFRLSITDSPIYYIDVEFKKLVVDYKAKAFALDAKVASMKLEAKGARAIFDPSARDGIGAWRCPLKTPYGGQFTNRFGRGCTWGVSRRLGRAFTAFAAGDDGKIGKLGQRLESRGDRKLREAGESSGRRLERRATQAARPPARERVAERIATSLESTAAGVRKRSQDSSSRRLARRTGVKPSAKTKPSADTKKQFFDDISKYLKNLNMEEADYLINPSTPDNMWISRDGDSDGEWLDRIEGLDGYPDEWVALPNQYLPYLTGVDTDTIDKPSLREMVKKHGKLEKPAKVKKSKREKVGSKPKKSPISKRLAEKLSDRADSVRQPGTRRKQKGRKPRSTRPRLERAARAMSETADRVISGEKKQPKTKQSKSMRAKKRSITPAKATLKSFPKNPQDKLMPDITTLPQQTQDDVKAAVQKEYDEVHDLWENILKKENRVKKSKSGNLHLDDVKDVVDNPLPTTTGLEHGRQITDAHNLEVLSEIINSGDYSKIDELKPLRRSRILTAAGISVPPQPKRKPRKPKTPPVPPATPPSPPPAPPAPPTPPTPPAPPTPPTPPTPTINPSTPPTPPSPDKIIPDIDPDDLSPNPPNASKRDMSIPGVEPEGTLWNGFDVSGLVKRTMRGGGEPLFIDPLTRRVVDVSKHIPVVPAVETLEKKTYPKVSRDKATLLKYPTRKIAGVQREIVPGVSDRAVTSWRQSVLTYDPNVAEFWNQVESFQPLSSLIDELTETFPYEVKPGKTTPDDAISPKTASVLVDHLQSVNYFVRANYRTSSGYPAGTPEQIKGGEIDFVLDALRSYISSDRNGIDVDPVKISDLPEWFMKIPVTTNPFSDSELWRPDATGGANRWGSPRLYNDYRHLPAIQRLGTKILVNLFTEKPDDLIESVGEYVQLYDSMSAEVDRLLAQWRDKDSKLTAVGIRKLVTLGYELENLGYLIETYLDTDEIAEALAKQRRTRYANMVKAQNTIIEKAQKIKNGELKVGGKLLPEELQPQDGVVRTSDEIEELLLKHKSDTPFSAIDMLSEGEIEILGPDEFEYLNAVLTAQLTSVLPSGTKVDWAGSPSSNSEIAQLYAAMTFSGYNDLPIVVNEEELELLINERDESGKPKWFVMTRYVKENPSAKPGSSAADLAREYLYGDRWPVGSGGSMGGRGDNYAGGYGYQHYGDGGILTLVSADSRITSRGALVAIKARTVEMIEEAAAQRDIEMLDYLRNEITSRTTSTSISDDELQSLVNKIKENTAAKSTKRFKTRGWSNNTVDINLSTGTPLTEEVMATSNALFELWTQLELIKLPQTDDDSKEWNERILALQKTIFDMDEAEIAIFAGYDGYTSQELDFVSLKEDNATWREILSQTFDPPGGNRTSFRGLSNPQQIMWLNRTGLVIFEEIEDYDQIEKRIKRYFNVGDDD
jgi:hypothetical protein